MASAALIQHVMLYAVSCIAGCVPMASAALIQHVMLYAVSCIANPELGARHVGMWAPREAGSCPNGWDKAGVRVSAVIK